MVRFRRKKILHVVRLFATTILLIFVVKGLDFGLFTKAVQGFSLSKLGMALGLQFIVRVLMALQIGLCMKAFGIYTSIGRLFEINLIMTFYTLLVPGELVSGGVGWAKLTSSGVDKVGALAAMVTSRWVNTLLLFVIGILLAALDKSIETAHSQWILLTGAVALCMVYFALLSQRVFSFARRTLVRLVDLMKSAKFGEIVQRSLVLWTQFQSMGKRFHLTLFACGVLIHVLGILSHVLIVRELELPISWPTIAWIRSLVLILGLLPVSVGGFGVRESSLVYVLGLYSVDRETALAYSVILVATIYGVGLLGGLLELKDTLARGSGSSSVKIS